MAEIVSSSGAGSNDQQAINPLQLSLEQLNGLKTQIEEELQDLNRQLEALIVAKNRFLNAKATLQDVSASEDGARLLVPLNSSLYVPGQIADPNKVIVELGTGYFAEKDTPAALALIDRKSTLVGKSIESVESVVVQKRRSLDQIVQVMQYKISTLQRGKEEK